MKLRNKVIGLKLDQSHKSKLIEYKFKNRLYSLECEENEAYNFDNQIFMTKICYMSNVFNTNLFMSL